MEKAKEKTERMLDIFFRLFKGEEISVKQVAEEYGVSTKSISRDLNKIKIYLADNRESAGNLELQYSYEKKTYSLNYDTYLQPKELMAIVKLLIGSRAFDKKELSEIISKLKKLTSMQNRKQINEFIKNEMNHYHEIYHECDSLIENLWKLIRVIDKHIKITVVYYKQDCTEVIKSLQPVAITFSEYYFYLLAYTDEDKMNPHYFRVDRIKRIVEHREKFFPIWNFDEGQLKERIHYMQPGVYRRIKFEFTGPSVQAVLDRIPSAKIIKKDGKKYTVEASVYGKGINMFLLSQGSWVKVLEPAEYVEEMKNEIKKMNSYYF